MYSKNRYICLLLLLLSMGAYGIDFTRVNIAWQYDPRAPIKLNHRIIQQEDQLTVFLRFRADSLAAWQLEWLKQDDYDSEQETSFSQLSVTTVYQQAKERFLRIRFTKPREDVMVLKLTKGQSIFYYDIHLRNGSLPFPSIYPETRDGIPIVKKYLTTNEIQWVGNPSFHATSYAENFPMADPPMAKMKPLAPSVNPDSSFQFTNPAELTSDYFYVIKKDSNAAIGVTFLKAYPYYPEFKQLRELVASMQYLLNDAEIKAFQGSANLKQSFDSFWINTYKSKIRARNAIRNYFNWVEQANGLFTDFKAGWKTDRGMLFIVFGVPDEVYRTENNEEWYYDHGPAFEFTVLATFFSPKTYALRRRIDYREAWFDYLAAIRKGSND